MRKFIVIFAWFVFALSANVIAQHAKGNSLVIIDPELPSIDILRRQIHPDSRIVYLEKSNNPLVAILKILKAHAPVSALHIMSHGKPGQLIFSGTEVTTNMLDQNEGILSMWKDSFSHHGDVLLYGCEVGKGQGGIEFIQSLAVLAGLDVAASDNHTGSFKKGGDWFLEVKSGRIETKLVVSQKIIDQYPAVLQ
jgi:hypothetical protein